VKVKKNRNISTLYDNTVLWLVAFYCCLQGEDAIVVGITAAISIDRRCDDDRKKVSKLRDEISPVAQITIRAL
jgi:hypothetical protein